MRHFQFQPRYLDFYSKGEKVVDKNDFMSTIRTFCPHFGQQPYQKKNSPRPIYLSLFKQKFLEILVTW